MNRIESLPFNTYDVIGYLAPGFLLLFWSVNLFNAIWGDVFTFLNQEFSFVGQSIIIILIATTSYAMGHIIAIGASESIERICTSLIGHPSLYLIQKENLDFQKIYSNFKLYHKTNIGMIVNIILFFPIYLIIFIYSVTGNIKFIAKRLGDNEIFLLREKFNNKYGISIDSNPDWFSICTSHCFNHNQFIAQRAYNYVVIYGFCRNMSFVTNFIFFFGLVFILSFGTLISQDFSGWITFNYKYYIILYFFIPLISLLFSVMLSISFIKFQRRYAEEIIKSFIAMND